MSLRSSLEKIALLCGSLFVAIAMLEVLLRVLYPSPVRFLYPQEYYDFDTEIGHVLRPRQTAFTHDRPVSTNSLGLRNGEITREPAPGTLRVLALGDSQTFGNGLDLSETWPKQLERMLENENLGGSHWEIVNTGIPGTDTWQHEILLRRLLDSTHPHAVVLALYVNDVVPRYDPGNFDASALTNTWSRRLVYLLKRSSVVTWIYYRLFVPLYARRFGRGNSTEDSVISGEYDKLAERGWRQIEYSIREMKKLCDAHKVTLLVAILPRRDQISGNNPGRAYNERARAIVEMHGIEAIDLLRDLSAAYRLKGDTLFIPWDGHNSAVANQVIVARLTRSLADLPTRLGSPVIHGWTTRLSSQSEAVRADAPPRLDGRE